MNLPWRIPLLLCDLTMFYVHNIIVKWTFPLCSECIAVGTYGSFINTLHIYVSSKFPITVVLVHVLCVQRSPGCFFSFCRCSHCKWSINRLQLGSIGVRQFPGLSYMQVWMKKEVLNHMLGRHGHSLSIHLGLYWSQICPQFCNTLPDFLNMCADVPKQNLLSDKS